MIALFIFTGLLVFAAVFAVVWMVMFVVAFIRFKWGEISKEDLDKATRFCQANRAERKRRRENGRRSLDRII